MFGMGAIKPNRSRKIVANILNGLADVLAPKTNTKGIKKVDNIVKKTINEVTDNSSNYGNTIKKAGSSVDKDIKNVPDNKPMTADMYFKNIGGYGFKNYRGEY